MSGNRYQFLDELLRPREPSRLGT
uniref:Uncharacterized protein n=1 Tax=Arundo donax TaxID=35708 RepID=A0A0A8YTM8_ARUDO